ncbi:sterol desaturase family protein [Undibacterium sp. MH2W]|uniref:sterol desaturase family protein n=1 Tax=Undibacterium sp. MH2W TaxID=3413044 RepID=UPI003BF353F5
MLSFFNVLIEQFWSLQQYLFESAIQPLMLKIGLANLLEDAFDGTGWLLLGLLQIVLLLLVIRPLERWRPVEPITDRDSIKTDIFYTLLHRLGIFNLLMFFSLNPIFDYLSGKLHVAGIPTFNLDNIWPGFTDEPIVSLIVYFIILDFVGYWVHRAQHHFNWWWALHAVHHSQRQMTMWTDNRNHLIDDVIQSGITAILAQLIGVPPGQFIAVTLISQLSQSLQHANLRLSFGYWGKRLWVSPAFHRLHHGMSIGHENKQITLSEDGQIQEKFVLGGHNFGILLPCWDIFFSTANWDRTYLPTGIRDQVEAGDHCIANYGNSFLSQQWLGIKRLFNIGMGNK